MLPLLLLFAALGCAAETTNFDCKRAGNAADCSGLCKAEEVCTLSPDSACYECVNATAQRKRSDELQLRRHLRRAIAHQRVGALEVTEDALVDEITSHDCAKLRDGMLYGKDDCYGLCRTESPVGDMVCKRVLEHALYDDLDCYNCFVPDEGDVSPTTKDPRCFLYGHYWNTSNCDGQCNFIQECYQRHIFGVTCFGCEVPMWLIVLFFVLGLLIVSLLCWVCVKCCMMCCVRGKAVRAVQRVRAMKKEMDEMKSVNIDRHSNWLAKNYRDLKRAKRQR